ncbi:unnamed protein product [Clavelina lepadiformis]|uniref:Fibronectin type-III domain-containing protein n=1 Tax=Clavelina lepadiformis TaxID=159417 RepID=A0ABP0G513_CLALP
MQLFEITGLESVGIHSASFYLKWDVVSGTNYKLVVQNTGQAPPPNNLVPYPARDVTEGYTGKSTTNPADVSLTPNSLYDVYLYGVSESDSSILQKEDLLMVGTGGKHCIELIMKCVIRPMPERETERGLQLLQYERRRCDNWLNLDEDQITVSTVKKSNGNDCLSTLNDG